MIDCTSALAPMSIPGRFVEEQHLRGSTHSIRAISAFCWLPPDRWAMF